MKFAIESSQGAAFAACCWYLAEAAPTTRAALAVVNPRSAQCRVLALADDEGAVAVGDAWIRYAVDRGPVCASETGKPERFRTLELEGDDALVRDFVADAVRAYREQVLRRESADDGQKTYAWDPEGGEWVRGTSLRPRPLSTMYLSAAGEESVRDFRRFVAAAETLGEMHVAHSRVYAFHGVPGSGKSSLVRALAADAGLGVAVLGYWPGMTDSDVRDALGSVPPGCVVVLEDVDCLLRSATSMSAAGMLAALDALDALDARSPHGGGGHGGGGPLAVFLTTNRPDSLDPALRRRFDFVAEFSWATRAQAERMVAALVPEADFDGFWARAGRRSFPMSALQKYLVRCLMAPNPAAAAADATAFEALVDMANPRSGAESLYG